VDGQKQRNALTAAEQALRALAAEDPEKAVRAAARAAELDQISLYAALPDAVAAAVADLQGTGSVGGDAQAGLRAAVGPGPLQGLVDELAG
jgi:hypothetical protein